MRNSLITAARQPHVIVPLGCALLLGGIMLWIPESARSARPSLKAEAPKLTEPSRRIADEPWRAECEAMFERAKRRAIETYNVRFERPVEDDSPDPDGLNFPSANGLEVQIEIAADSQHRRNPRSAVLQGEEPDRDGWIAAAYLADGFVVEQHEVANGSVFVRFELFYLAAEYNSHQPSWDEIGAGVARIFKQAGDRCVREANERTRRRQPDAQPRPDASSV
jgi:hypothetical protein